MNYVDVRHNISWARKAFLSEGYTGKINIKRGNDMKEQITIGQRIRQLRHKADMLAVELSERTGIAAATISKYENDKREPSLRNIQKILKAVGSSLRDIEGCYA